jgi:hypothetical protein
MSAEDFIYDYAPEIREYLDSVSELFRKLLRRGLSVLHDLPDAEASNENTSAIVLLYRTAMALIDALGELSSLPSVEAFKIVLRSFFETKCYIEYIVESKTLERAAAYQTQHIMNRIRQYEKLDATTTAGIRFRARLHGDRLFGPSGISSVDTKSAIANLEKQLNREPFKTAYDKLRVKKNPDWYTIDGGPATFCQLCDHLQYQLAYDFLYRELSASVHATGAYIDSFFADHGRGKMHALRALPGYQHTTSMALSLVVDFFMQTTKKLVPKHYDRFARFYKNIYKPFRDKHVDSVNIQL